MKFVRHPRNKRSKEISSRNKSGLTLNLKELCKMRGIQHPYSLLRKLGISNLVIHKMLNGKIVFLKAVHIERICLALWCTPNDLFKWSPTGETVIPAGHPMHGLNRSLTESGLADEMAKMSLDELRQLRKVAQEIKSGKIAGE